MDTATTAPAQPTQARDALGVAGFTYDDLFEPARLRDLRDAFHAEVGRTDPDLEARFRAYAAGAPLGAVDESDLIVRMASRLGAFVAGLFSIQAEADAQTRETRELGVLFEFRKSFVRRRVLRRFSDERPPEVSEPEAERRVAGLLARAPVDGDEELATARVATELLDLEQALRKGPGAASEARARARALACRLDRESPADAPDPELAVVEALLSDVEVFAWYRGRRTTADHGYDRWVSFKAPRPVDHRNLVSTEHPFPELPEAGAGPERARRRRDGFELTDARMSRKQALGEIDYCIICHERDKDSCSKGLAAKDGGYAKNPLGVTLAGCPLDERISEMHALEIAGESIAALAVIMLDNPMCPGTGHRICNDCMKACIYQKQDPVDIPQAETRVLADVLALPYGFEVYDLLTRWNPLNRRRPHALPYNGKNVLVVGLGPAGYTLAHYLSNEGFGVVGVDGLKLEPLPSALVREPGLAPRPVRDWVDVTAPLSERVLAGFGGVSEYGITVRWDKNFLTLVRTSLERRRAVRFYGGVRFGGTLEVDDAWALGFDHVAVASGAGRPTVVRMGNNLARGIRKASDFLMALQLTGASKRASLANLQVRLPAVVVGGGLTAIDTATELIAYYVAQCEKYLERFEVLAAERGPGGEDELLAVYDGEEREIAGEFLEHGRAVRRERWRAEAAGERPDFAPLVRAWGGVTIAYRKCLEDSPAYRLNHEEIIKALEEGIYFAERLDPREAVPDAYGAVAAVRFERMLRTAEGGWAGTGGVVTLPARAVFVAAGTHPNTVYEKEHPGTFERDAWGEFFTSHSVRRGADGAARLEPDPRGVMTSYARDGRFVSFYGDNHPAYEGNVVKAMASARNGYAQVLDLFAPELATLDPSAQPERDAALAALFGRLDDLLVARVERVERLTPTIVEVVVRAPMAARKFRPGQFYRLQNYETTSPVVAGTRLQMEGVALTGAWVEPDAGLLGLIVLEMGGSSRLCAYLRPGERVVVMGPTGAPTEIPTGETVLLAGGGLGNAVLFSIAKALRESGNRVLYFAGYKDPRDLFKRDEIEAATDQVVWSSDVGPRIEPRRPEDRAFVGNIVEAMLAYARGELGAARFDMGSVDRIVAIGSDRMMAAVAAARHGVLAPYLKPGHAAVGSINSMMQCMMKEICAQCLQKHVDPDTGKESVVFSCFNQDQPLDRVDFGNLNSRLKANSVQEKLTSMWLTHVLARSGLERV